jgi:YHS domain-containing protein
MLRALLELIVIFLVVRAVWRVIGSMVTISAGVRRRTASGEPQAVKLVRDPVCGTYVSPDSALADGQHYFCSEKCRDEYRSRTTETRRHGASF